MDTTDLRPTVTKMPNIDIRIQRIVQLYDPLDPSPFHEKSLSRDVENHIVDCAGDYGPNAQLQLRIHAPASIKEHDEAITQAIHAHFEAQHEQCGRRYRRRMRHGKGALFDGLVVLGITLLVRAFLVGPGQSQILVALGEGLLIIGWVAMWRPIEILLFERVETHQDSALFDRLSRIPIELIVEDAEPDFVAKSAQTSVMSDLPACSSKTPQDR